MSVTSDTEKLVAHHVSGATISFATLGCKTNQFETAAMQETLGNAGYLVVPFNNGADIVIVNTCTVTSATDAQSRNLIRRARRLNANCRVIVTGCYAQVSPEAFHDLPGVSLVIGNEEKHRLVDFLQLAQKSPQVKVSDVRRAKSVCLNPLTTFSGRSRAFVQIQNGCDAYCSYCIIPYARGPSRSVQFDEVLKQVVSLIESGFQEVVLTGIHIGAYGADLSPQLSLNTLIKRIESETNVQRLRLGSIEPTEFTDELLTTISNSNVVCPHFHIPMQSGDDNVLQRMGRSYTTNTFAQLVTQIRDGFPDAAICLDVITGFPGETDQEFVNTYNLIDRLPVTNLHVFPYSKRPGTPAATMKPQVSGKVSKHRAQMLRKLALSKHVVFAKNFVGRELEVVVESNPRKGLFKGLSRNYLEVRFSGDLSLSGQCIMVKPTDWDQNALRAEMCN